MISFNPSYIYGESQINYEMGVFDSLNENNDHVIFEQFNPNFYNPQESQEDDENKKIKIYENDKSTSIKNLSKEK